MRIGWGLTISSVNLRKFLILDGIVCWWQVSNYTPQLFWSYRIFSIKRRGAFIQISAPQTGIYSNLVFIRGPAFIYWMYFSSIHFLPSVLEVYWIENQTNWEPNVKQCHELLSHLTESGMSFIKKHHWPEQWLNFSQLFISPWNTEEVYRQLLDSKRTVQAIQSKLMASRRFPLHQFWERQNMEGFKEVINAGETHLMILAWWTGPRK